MAVANCWDAKRLCGWMAWCLAIFTLGDIKDDGMGMVELAGRRTPRLPALLYRVRTSLQRTFQSSRGGWFPPIRAFVYCSGVFEGDSNAFAVRLHERDRRRLPKLSKRPTSGAELVPSHPARCSIALTRFAVGIRVLVGHPLPHELLAALRMLSLAETGELFVGNCSSQSEAFQLAFPAICRDFAALRPVTLFLRGEFLPVVRSAPGLPRAAWIW